MSTLWQDTGFQGYAPEGVKIEQSKKKPKNAALTKTEKGENQGISKVRVKVEHLPTRSSAKKTKYCSSSNLKR
jgi:hypothetical protein